MILKVSTARNRPIFMADSSDHVSGKTGLTLTITASKDGGSFSSISPTVTELSNGWYNLALTTTHTNTQGALALHISSTGADPTDVVDEVCPDLPGVSSATLSSSERNAIADALFVRASSNWEASAPVKSLGAAVMKATHRTRNNAGTIETYKADGTTLFSSQTATTDPAGQPIKELTGAA